LENVKNDSGVEAERVERATVVDEVREHVDLVSEVALEVAESTERATFPRSEYERLCDQLVPYAECYGHVPSDYSEGSVEFVETGRQPGRCHDCDGGGTTVCSSCGGRGTTACVHCGGSGTRRQDCPDCSGSGYDVDGWSCTTCDGSGEVEGACDSLGCDRGRQECGSCRGGGRRQCSSCGGEGAVVTALHGVLEFTRTRTVETAATAFQTDTFELTESDGTVVDRSAEGPDDRAGEESGDTSRVWRRRTEQRSIPCMSVAYEVDGESYTAGWVDREVRLGEYPPSEAAVRERIERTVADGRFEYDRRPAGGTTSLLVEDVTRTAKTILWVLGGVVAVSVVLGAVDVVLGPVVAPVTGVLLVVAVLGVSVYVTARLHGRDEQPVSGRTPADVAGPAVASVAAVAVAATGQVSLMLAGALAGFAAALWGVSVARRLRSVADEAAFVTDQRRTVLEEALDDPERVVDRHDLGGLIPGPAGETERRAARAASVVGIGCVGLASLYTLGTLGLEAVGFPASAGGPVAAGAVLALPAVLTAVSVGALVVVPSWRDPASTSPPATDAP
jgi:hypothetical protein